MLIGQFSDSVRIFWMEIVSVFFFFKSSDMCCKIAPVRKVLLINLLGPCLSAHFYDFSAYH